MREKALEHNQFICDVLEYIKKNGGFGVSGGYKTSSFKIKTNLKNAFCTVFVVL